MSSFNKSNNGNGGGQKRRGNFDSVPADDGFRNYMSRKIELQRKQFGLVVPPPPPSPSPPSPTQKPVPVPPKILKRSKQSKSKGSSDSLDPQSTSIHAAAAAATASSNTNNDTPSSPEKKSVRFHSSTMSSVLANLKQKNAGKGILRKRSSSKLRSSERKRRRKLQSFVASANTNSGEKASDESNNSPNESLLNSNSSPAKSVLGVLDNLQKRHGISSSSSKKKRSSSSSSSSHSARTHRDCANDEDQIPPAASTSMLESLESIEEKADLFGDNTEYDCVKRVQQSKRKRESPRCKGKSILEGLEQTIHDSGGEQHGESPEEMNNLSKATLQKSAGVTLTHLTQHSPTSSDVSSTKDSPSPKHASRGAESPLDPNSTDHFTTNPKDGIPADSTTFFDQQSSPQTNSVVEAPINPSRKANYRPDLFFTGVVILVNGHTNPDATSLMRLLHKHGGDLEKYETRRITHIIAEQLSAAKANIYKRQKKPTPVCKPEWIIKCVEQGKLLPFGDYLLEDVRNVDVVGTKSMKSFFGSKADADKHESPAKVDPGKCSPGATRKGSAKAKDDCSNTGPNGGSASNEPSSPTSRWHDTHPSKANYNLNGQVRTVGNDPDFLDSYFSNSRLSYIGSFKQRIKPAKSNSSRNQSKAGTQKFVMLVDMVCILPLASYGTLFGSSLLLSLSLNAYYIKQTNVFFRTVSLQWWLFEIIHSTGKSQ